MQFQAKGGALPHLTTGLRPAVDALVLEASRLCLAALPAAPCAGQHPAVRRAKELLEHQPGLAINRPRTNGGHFRASPDRVLHQRSRRLAPPLPARRPSPSSPRNAVRQRVISHRNRARTRLFVRPAFRRHIQAPHRRNRPRLAGQTSSDFPTVTLGAEPTCSCGDARNTAGHQIPPCRASPSRRREWTSRTRRAGAADCTENRSA